MITLRSALLVVGLVIGVVLVSFGTVRRASAEDVYSSAPTASELLEDGTDAIADHAPESAERILKQLIDTYPQSQEAARARRALASLGHESDTPEVRAAIRAGEAERTEQYRRAFLNDVGDRVFFAENSAIIGGRARSVIINQGRWLKARPNLSVTIVGRADDGDAAASRSLSLHRAESVRDRLVATGVDTRRIAIKAVGDQDKLALCGSALCQAQNRNAEVFINDFRDERGWQSGEQDAPVGPPAVGTGAYNPRSAAADQAP